MELLENRPFDEIEIGDQSTLTRTLTQKDIQLFAIMSGDVNPAHLDEAYAKDELFHKIVAHGMWGGALISTVLGTQLPGPGTIYLSQTFKFLKPVGLGDTITVALTVKEKIKKNSQLILSCVCTNQKGVAVITGEATVLAPTKKVRRPYVPLPKAHLKRADSPFEKVFQQAGKLEPVSIGMVYPVDVFSLKAAAQSAVHGWSHPTLIGPEEQIRLIASTEKIDLTSCTLRNAETPASALREALSMVEKGSLTCLMKGAMSASDLMAYLISHDTTLHTNRHMSHIVVCDVATYPRPLLVTDSVIHAYPDLEDKKDIVQNAIRLAHALDIARPKVAILSAIEEISSPLESTFDAASLCKMNERGQITGALIDGPLTFDHALSQKKAAERKLNSPVAGQADILVVPNLESGSIAVRQLVYMTDTYAAGIVIGGRVPIVFPRQEDGLLERLAGIAIAQIFCTASS